MAKAWKVKGIKPKKSYRWNAEIILPVKVEEVFSWAEYIHDPDKITELHNLRISVKRLRYSMEFFEINYGKTFKTCLKVLEDLQELLGEIHDCDVLQQVLGDYLQDFQIQGDADAAIGIKLLIRRYRKMHRVRYQRFLKIWDELEERGFKGELLTTIKGGS